MFRLLQGDVGSGKTIISLIAASNVIESKYQVAFMAPTEVLAEQHFQSINKYANKKKWSRIFCSIFLNTQNNFMNPLLYIHMK